MCALPHPPCFCQRVRNCLKIKGLSFWLVQKSAEEYEKKRDSQNCSRKKSSEKNPPTLDARSPRSSGQAGCASLAGCAMRKCSIRQRLKLNNRKKQSPGHDGGREHPTRTFTQH